MSDTAKSTHFFVPGIPKGQPRPRAFARNIGGKYVARVFDAGTAEEWKSQIAATARTFAPTEPYAGPVKVDVVYVFPRPKHHFKASNPAKGLRDDAAYWYTQKPDSDNLNKATFDALTQIGLFWRDDCQICAGFTSKRFGDAPGAFIDIMPIQHFGQ